MNPTNSINPTLLEKLSELEHQQWQLWIYSTIVKLEKILDVSNKLPVGGRFIFMRNELEEIIKKWDKNRIPYSELPEEVKELDRIWARKVLKVIDSEVF